MLGIRYLKANPTSFVLQFRNGALVKQGPGLAFWYFGPTSTISLVPISSVDVPFAFSEVSSDFQDVVVQGTIAYRIKNPVAIAALLDYSVDPQGRYQSDDPTKLGERLVQVAQTGARTFFQTRSLRESLVSSSEVAVALAEALRKSETVERLGVEILDVTIASLKPDPEMSKALQTQARERLLREADEAIYARRNASVELERTIRENELATEIAVALKRRQVRETEMQAEIAVERQKADLVDTRVENERKEAVARGEALRAVLEPVKEIDWRTLLAMQGQARSEALIASAFDTLAQNAQKIGELNISPDLLSALLKRSDS